MPRVEAARRLETVAAFVKIVPYRGYGKFGKAMNF
jgi:hypothetical protein